MIRRAGARIVALTLLVAGVPAGIHLGQSPTRPPSDVAQVEAADRQLLRDRQNRHAVSEARRREAVVRATADVRVAAGRARKLRRAVKVHRRKSKVNPCFPYAGNRATGCRLVLHAGYGIDQFHCLDHLWDRESGWNAHAANQASGAYGIPQARPGHKMSRVAGDWRDNPSTQIAWGLGYIRDRYASPCDAWHHSQDTGSY